MTTAKINGDKFPTTVEANIEAEAIASTIVTIPFCIPVTTGTSISAWQSAKTPTTTPPVAPLTTGANISAELDMVTVITV